MTIKDSTPQSTDECMCYVPSRQHRYVEGVCVWCNAEKHETFADALGPVERKVIWAALCAMVKDIHCPQDQLTEGEWLVASKLFDAFDREMNRG